MPFILIHLYPLSHSLTDFISIRCVESASHATRTWTFETDLKETVCYGEGDGRVNTAGQVVGLSGQTALRVGEDLFPPPSKGWLSVPEVPLGRPPAPHILRVVGTCLQS